MFSQTSEYALRVVVYLASLEGKLATISQIAIATRTPQGYLAKVLRNLALAELVHSQRGPQGGSILARSATDITVYDVIQAVDPIQRITTCPLGIKGHGINLCPLHHGLDQAIAMVEEAFKKTSIAELISAPAGPHPLCDLPPARRKRARV
jgi:Rrf2 family nitric oxide-sensitive transcriptional repressor